MSEKCRRYDQRFTQCAAHTGTCIQLPSLILGKEEAWYCMTRWYSDFIDKDRDQTDSEDKFSNYVWPCCSWVPWHFFFPLPKKRCQEKGREGKRPSCCVWQGGSRILSKKNPLEKLVCEVQISLIFVFQTIYKLPSSCRFLLSLVSVIYNFKCCS